MTTSRGSGRRSSSRGITITPQVMIISILIVIVLALGAFIVGRAFNRNEDSADEVTLEPTLSAGPNPFMPPVGVDEPNVRPPPKVGGPRPGNTIGLFGGSGQQASCDPQRLVAFLEADRAKSVAWASVLGIQPDEIKSFVAS